MKIDNSNKIILDLCGGTGAWSKPYKDAGYDVRVITLPDCDVRNWKNTWLGKYESSVYGILAAPPCTMFSFARTNAKKPRDLKEGMECVRACLEIIWSFMEVRQETKKKTLPLKFWALENPNGMLKFFLGKPAFQFNPYDFGDQYQKNTHLWGWFNEPKKNPIELTAKQKELHKTNSQPLPVLKPYKSLNKELQKKFDRLASREIAPEMFGKLDRQARRAITPAGFAKAFFQSNQ
jgi:hypothetical protein